jgi:hypothetical protein
MLNNNRGNWTLIGLLVGVAIVIVAIAMMWGGNGSNFTTAGKAGQDLQAQSDKKTVIGQSMDAAKGSQCKQQLVQIRQSIEMFKSSNEENPASLKDLGLAVGPEFFVCPTSKMPYVYDPAAGTVRCPYQYHTNF